MRISDWSSDVCSSDLIVHRVHLHGCAQGHILLHQKQSVCPELVEGPYFLPQRRKKRCFDKLSTNGGRSEEHTSELQSLMRSSYAVFCLKKKNSRTTKIT